MSVWRELRRLKQQLGTDDTLEKARQAADESKWHDYIKAMGGVFAKREQRPLRLAYEVIHNNDTGECRIGAYDGNCLKRIKGLLYDGKLIITRLFSWRMEKSGTGFSNLEFCK